MLNSSAMIRSSGIGCSFFHSCSPASPVSPMDLWIVSAGYSVHSRIRLLAMPVGAHKRITAFLSNASCTAMMKRITVVFPLPGPPVMMDTGFSKTFFTATCCFAFKIISCSFWIFLKIRSTFTAIPVCIWSLTNAAAAPSSAWKLLRV